MSLWFVLLVNTVTLDYGQIAALSYATEDRCLDRVAYIQEQFEEFKLDNPEYELRCVEGIQ